MAQRLRALVALAEEVGSVPRAPLAANNTVLCVTQVPDGSLLFSGHGTAHMSCTDIPADRIAIYIK